MSDQTIHLEDLVGRKIFDLGGQCAGRIEEVIVRRKDGKYLVAEIHIGRRALIERLSITGISMSFASSLGAHRHSASHKAKWEQVDLSDPRRPKLKCHINELEEL